MTKRHWFAGITLIVLGCLLAGLGSPPDAPAQDKKKDDPTTVKADPVADDVQHISMAYELAELGRKTKSPEMLIAAAKVLRKINTIPGTEKAEVKGGTDEKTEEVSLLKESDALLAEAKKLGKDDTAIAALADRIAKEGKRGTLGGPRSYYHRPGAGTTITWNLTFAGGQPASISVQGNGRNSLTMTVTGPGGHYWTFTGPAPFVNWVPNGTKTFTVQVTNNGPGAVAYTLYHN